MTKSQIAKYAAVKIVGTAISVFIFFSINQTYKEKNKAAVDNAVTKAELKLADELNKVNLVIEAMAFFFESTDTIPQPLFERFTDPFLEQLNGIGAFEWAPRVEDDLEQDLKRLTIITKMDTTDQLTDNLVVSTSKGLHFPISRLNPLQSLEKAIGYDLYSDSVRKSAIDKAIATGEVALTGPISVILNNNGVPGIMAVKAVSDTVTSEIKGVVTGVYRMDTFVGNTLSSEMKILDAQIVDATSDTEMLYSSLKDGNIDRKRAENLITKRIEASDRIWEIRFFPKVEYKSFPHVSESYVILVLGLISSLLLTYAVKKRDSYNERLEARVRLRTKELEESNELKENLLREIHHRVKNNLQITSSLMNMQKRKLTSPEAITAIEDSQARILAIALTHQKIYQEKDTKAVNLNDYLNDLMARTKKISSAFSYEIECPEILVDLDRAVPLALIISELATNAVQHAYPDSDKYNELVVHVERASERKVSLTMRDNGKGLPEDFELDDAKGIGFEIIKALCRQISAQFTYLSNGTGTQFTLIFENEA